MAIQQVGCRGVCNHWTGLAFYRLIISANCMACVQSTKSDIVVEAHIASTLMVLELEYQASQRPT